MERIGVRELRQHASRYLERVKAGETVEVTDRGRLVALLVPPAAATTARERLIAEDRLIPAVRRFRLPEPSALADGEPGTQSWLDEQRDEEPGRR